ncbi:MAG TPA: hypothetical protein VHJ40_07230 [Actinomycetota bacterium]|jgi:hypothetical protein|nr:hypothetical protein [Actinomycetota bacterium]
MSTPQRRKRSKLFWVIVVIVALPVLFYLFEFVVPRLLPPNY